MYKNNFEQTIEPGCPWYSYQQFFGPPNVNWCEPTICAWINEPFNAWSNLGYFLIGLYIVLKATSQIQKNFGPIVVFTGIASFIYHSTNNFFTQYFDYLGMLTLVGFVIAFNISRLKKDLSLLNMYLGWTLSSLLILLNILMMSKIPIQMIIIFGCALIIILELCCRFKSKMKLSYKYLILSLSLLAIGQTLALLDNSRIYCPEQLWITGHVLWHIFGSLGLGAYFLHIKKIELSFRQ